jgi:hypothetical protein
MLQWRLLLLLLRRLLLLAAQRLLLLRLLLRLCLCLCLCLSLGLCLLLAAQLLVVHLWVAQLLAAQLLAHAVARGRGRRRRNIGVESLRYRSLLLHLRLLDRPLLLLLHGCRLELRSRRVGHLLLVRLGLLLLVMLLLLLLLLLLHRLLRLLVGHEKRLRRDVLMVLRLLRSMLRVWTGRMNLVHGRILRVPVEALRHLGLRLPVHGSSVRIMLLGRCDRGGRVGLRSVVDGRVGRPLHVCGSHEFRIFC